MDQATPPHPHPPTQTIVLAVCLQTKRATDFLYDLFAYAPEKVRAVLARVGKGQSW